MLPICLPRHSAKFAKRMKALKSRLLQGASARVSHHARHLTHACPTHPHSPCAYAKFLLPHRCALFCPTITNPKQPQTAEPHQWACTSLSLLKVADQRAATLSLGNPKSGKKKRCFVNPSAFIKTLFVCACVCVSLLIGLFQKSTPIFHFHFLVRRGAACLFLRTQEPLHQRPGRKCRGPYMTKT